MKAALPAMQSMDTKKTVPAAECQREPLRNRTAMAPAIKPMIAPAM